MTQDDFGWIETKLNDSKWLRMTQNSYGNYYWWLNMTLDESSLHLQVLSEVRQILISRYTMTRWHLREIPPYCVFQALLTISYRLRALKTPYFHFCKSIKNWKINWNNFCKEFWKKKYSEHWTLGRRFIFSQRTNEPVFYIVDWRICCPNNTKMLNWIWRNLFTKACALGCYPHKLNSKLAKSDQATCYVTVL